MKRLFLLIPFNAFILKANLEYARNIKYISERFWPRFLTFSKTNAFIAASMQAIFFTTIYIGGTFSVIGINPYRAFKDL